MKTKFITAVLSAAMLISSTAHAEVLGDVIGGFTNDMGAYSVFHKVEFDGGSVGKQTEYYVEYTPNTDAVPVIAYDGTLWGQSDINEAVNTLASEGYRTAAGINGDFFSFKTGLPMGTTISGGEIISKENEGQDAIGFRSDGSAFIDFLQIKTTAYKDGSFAEVECINKWYQGGYDTIFMLTDKMGSTTKTTGDCMFVICSPIEGGLKVNSEMKLRVDDKVFANGEINIPQGKIILVIDSSFGKPDLMSFMNSLNIGDEFMISNTEVNSEKGLWSQASEGTSSVGGRLLKSGQIGSGFEAGVAPRTAIGVKENGNVIMYVLDGRQSGHSYGAQLTTLARRMQEIGCIDAINLDGGGSTAMGVLLGGEDNFMIINSPSDGYLRKCANFIFLKDNRQPSGEPWIVNIAPIDSTYYLGETINLTIESAYDTNNYRMNDYSALNTRVDNAVINSDGSISFNSLGDAVIRVSGGIFNKEFPITVHRIRFADINGHWAKDKIEAVSDREIINGISDNNQTVFMPDNRMTRSEFAAIISRFAELDYSEYSDVSLPFADNDSIQEWALPYIKTVYGSGIMTGKSDDDGSTLYFDANSPVTRAEAMTMLNRVLNISDYSETAFADDYDIPDWARDGITKLYSAGIAKGYEDNTIRPHAHITRAEGTALLFNCLDK